MISDLHSSCRHSKLLFWRGLESLMKHWVFAWTQRSFYFRTMLFPLMTSLLAPCRLFLNGLIDVCLKLFFLLSTYALLECMSLWLENGFLIFLPVDLATSCYEHACVKFPNDLEIIMGLFNCYVREYSFVKQQQVWWYLGLVINSIIFVFLALYVKNFNSLMLCLVCFASALLTDSNQIVQDCRWRKIFALGGL